MGERLASKSAMVSNRTASGIVFITLEDETPSANLIVRPCATARHIVALLAAGRIEGQGEVAHL